MCFQASEVEHRLLGVPLEKLSLSEDWHYLDLQGGDNCSQCATVESTEFLKLKTCSRSPDSAFDEFCSPRQFAYLSHSFLSLKGD